MAKQGQCTDRARRSPRRDGDTPAGGLRTRPLVLPVLGLVIALLLLAPLSGAQPRSRAVPADGGRGPDLALPNGAGASSAGEPSAVAAPRYAGAPGIVSGRAYKHDATAPLRTLKPVAPSASGPPRAEADGRDRTVWVNHTDRPDPVVQRSAAPLGATSALLAMPATATGWEGISESTSGCGCLPPDTNGDIGPNDYVQTVNAAFEVWSRTGAVRYGPANINTLWNGFGGVCASNNRGDPVLLYDAAADRWLISQFAFSVSIFGQPQGPYDECIAISTTGDPTGSWYRYGFQLSTADFPDYPHFGVWPDGYYMSVNWFTNASTYAGPRPYVFDRTAMLNGQAATFQTTSGPLGSAVAPLLPAHLTGRTPPPAGQPNVFAEFGSPLNLYTFQVNWATPASTAWTKSASLAVAGFTQLCASTRDCIPQPGTSQKLDGLGDRLMNRLAYRNLGDHDVLVVNHTVDAGGGQAGVRWYEIRNPATTPTIYQQGSYAPDTDSRWVGSAAMDAGGDIAVGYSVSSGTTYPSIRVTGRLAADSLNTLPQGETTLLTGTGYQADPSGLSDYNRWGDYSSMSVDPVDDCTFWYTSEYNNSKSYTWGTRIGSFKFAGCGAGPAPTSTPAPPTATTTPAPPTATSTPVPPAATATDTATATPAPITTATNTPIPATATATSTPLPTFTPTPTSTATAPRPPTPTNTPKPHKH